MDAFIEQIQHQQSTTTSSGVSGLSLLKGGKRDKDVFKEVVPLCENSWKLIGQVGASATWSSCSSLSTTTTTT